MNLIDLIDTQDTVCNLGVRAFTRPLQLRFCMPGPRRSPFATRQEQRMALGVSWCAGFRFRCVLMGII